MYDLVIVGAGGFGRELYTCLWDILPRDEYHLKGFLGRESGDLDQNGLGAQILSDPETYRPEPNDRFALAIGDIDARRSVTEILVSKGAHFLSLVHPTAVVWSTAKLGRGCVIYPFALVSNEAVLGDFVHLSNYASVGHDARVGACCLLAPYATMNGFSVLEDDVYLSTHCTVVPERRVGQGSKISANSVVAHDVPPYSFVHGVPGIVTSRMRVTSRASRL